MKTSKILILFILGALALPCSAHIGIDVLGDSLTQFTGFSPVWSPAVKVKYMRVNGNHVTVKTNTVLKDVRWTPQSVSAIKRHVSRWVLGHEKGKVTLIAGNTNIEELVTDCARGVSNGKHKDLTERHIALYPSHGLYYNANRGEWIWQRATLWTTVEDLYSQEYVRLIRKMLENAGATIYMPRAGLEYQEPGISHMPQWTEGARYWLMKQGVDSTLWDLYEGDEYKDDMKCRAMWINSLQAPIDLCLAFHTDGLDSGDDSTIVGTLVIYTAKDDDNKLRLRDGRIRERVNRNLADWIQTQVTEDLRVIAPEWTRRQLKEANYCETRVPVVPSIILELLSHKNMADMKYGLDPHFRFSASRAVYKGILRFLNGKAAVVQPLPVEQIAIDADGVLRWEAPTDTLEPSATPSYYMVYVQADDGEWDVQQVENATHCAFSLKPGVRYTYYVIAGNEGGLSLPSPKVSAYLSEQKDAPMALVVDGFEDSYGVEWFADSLYAGIVPGSYACEDYVSYAYIGEQWNFTRSSVWTNDDNCGWGACYRDHAGKPTIGNTHDYSVLHGRVLQQMPISYISCTSGLIDSLQPAMFRFMDIVCGRNRIPLGPEVMKHVADYISQGGHVLMSTDHYSALDPSWAKHYLHASFYASHATRSGIIHPTGHRPYRILMSPNEEQLFTACPEGLMPEGEGAMKMATYQDMRCPAAVGYDHQTLVFGFPLEAVPDFDRVYRQAVEWLLEKDAAKMAE